MGGGEKTKGHSQRLISVPGYHIHPQWDLTHLRMILEERRHRRKSFSLSLAPMVDLFSVLVIFLLMNFSSSGEIFFVSKEVVLPKASRGAPMQSFPLVSIVGENIYFEADTTRNIGVKGSQIELNDSQSPKFRDFLRRLKKLDQQLSPQNPATQINLQADEKTPVEAVKRVMKILAEEGWSGINFIVEPQKTKEKV